MQRFVEVTICVGSNADDKKKHVAEAICWLEKLLISCRISSIYTTPDCCGAPIAYDNAVVKGKTTLSREDFEKIAESYEYTHGRDEKARRENYVPVDIDIVVYDGVILREKDYNSCFFKIGFEEINLRH